MTTVRKLLLAVLMVSLAGSAFGAGTFASFTATTTSAGSTFATGSLVMNNSNGTVTSCLSTSGGVDTNANASCGAAFTASVQKPGDAATNTITLTNAGTTDAQTGVVVYGTACTDGNSGAVNGSGSMCGAVQTYVQQLTPQALCRYGKGASGVVNGGVAVATGAIAAQAYKLTVDTTVHDNIALPAATYTQVSLLAAVNSAISAWATANLDPAGILWITSKTTGGTSNVTLAAPTSGTSAITSLGFGSGSPVLTNTGGQTACSYDGVHTLTHLAGFLTAATGFAAGTFAAAAVNTYTVAVQLPLSADNTLQGRSASIGYSWTAQ